MRKILRIAAAPMFAAAFLLATLSAPANADTTTGTTESDAEIAQEWQTAWDTYKFSDTTPPAPGSGRSRATNSISVDIDAPMPGTFYKYSDFNNHLGRNPFLKRVVTHKQWGEPPALYRNLTAIEEIPYEGMLVVSKTHAQQRLHADRFYYETDSWSEPNVVTHQKITFTPLPGGKTRVTENLTFEADSSLIDFVAANGTAAHQQLQGALKQAIESGEL
ncbi:SRPBCC family protein [Microbispora sp. H13382]|uniref:SRPBCC family protein n=1 Tax=Microbispora sp. H13382 TaxID=2729112 RepID=UPI0016019F1B|nr:SRPBCC family protein [Microbispora sp. H13382]